MCSVTRYSTMSSQTGQGSRLAIDVAGEVEVVVVPLDLVDAHYAGETGNIDLPCEHIDDAVNVLRPQPVLGSVLHKPAAGVDEEDPFAVVGVVSMTTMQAGLPVP